MRVRFLTNQKYFWHENELFLPKITDFHRWMPIQGLRTFSPPRANLFKKYILHNLDVPTDETLSRWNKNETKLLKFLFSEINIYIFMGKILCFLFQKLILKITFLVSHLRYTNNFFQIRTHFSYFLECKMNWHNPTRDFYLNFS